MKDAQSSDPLLTAAFNAAVRWAKTDRGYFTMRDKVEAYLQANTPDQDPSLWFVNNSRKLAMHHLMSKCIMPLTPAELKRLDHEVRDIASTLPQTAVRGCHR